MFQLLRNYSEQVLQEWNWQLLSEDSDILWLNIKYSLQLSYNHGKKMVDIKDV